MIILIALLAVGFASGLFFIKTDKTATSTSEMNGTEKKESVQLPDSKVENKLEQEIDECIKKFSGLEDMKTEEVEKLNADIVSTNAMKARYYYVCQAVKNNDSKYCDALKADEKNYAFCQEEYIQLSGMTFPALKSNSCDKQIIDACKRSGSDDCETICQGLYLGKIDECNKLQDGNPLKGACLAIDQKDINLCSALKSKNDRRTCQEEYYFVRAVKEDNPSLLDSIEDAAERFTVMLYFDKNHECEKILAGFGEDVCKKYDLNYLNTLKGQIDEPQKNEVK